MSETNHSRWITGGAEGLQCQRGLTLGCCRGPLRKRVSLHNPFFFFFLFFSLLLLEEHDSVGRVRPTRGRGRLSRGEKDRLAYIVRLFGRDSVHLSGEVVSHALRETIQNITRQLI